MARRSEALAAGVGLALAVALPAALLAQIVDSRAPDGETPDSVFVLVPVVLGGMVLGGWIVGRRVGSRTLATGGVAGAVAIAVVLGVGLARRSVADEEVGWAAVPAVLALGALLGVVGAVLGRGGPARTRP